LITFDGVTKRYPDGTVALDDVSLECPTGQITVFVGTSGGGKTTALRTINRMVDPTSGTVEVITQQLYNPSLSRNPIGRSVITCTFVDARNRTCVATYLLPKGALVATGAVQSRLFFEIPIVGGTGLYDNARGTLTVTATHFRPRHEVLLFRLVG